MTSIDSTDRTGADGADERPLRREATAVVGAIGVLASLVVAGTVTAVAQDRYTDARFASPALVAADRIDVDVADSPASVTALSIDVGRLGRGGAVDQCFVARAVVGGAEVDVRLTGRRGGGSGVDRFVTAHVEIGSGERYDCGDFASDATVFTGRLERLALDHGSFDDGVSLLDRARDGDEVTVRVEVSAIPDAGAHGGTTSFWLDVEGRR